MLLKWHVITFRSTWVFFYIYRLLFYICSFSKPLCCIVLYWPSSTYNVRLLNTSSLSSTFSWYLQWAVKCEIFYNVTGLHPTAVATTGTCIINCCKPKTQLNYFGTISSCFKGRICNSESKHKYWRNVIKKLNHLE